MKLPELRDGIWPVRASSLGLPWLWLGLALTLTGVSAARAGDTEKPVLHGRHWVAIAGKPLAATAGSRIFQEGGNAVDAACAMLAAVCVMFDDVAFGGETQALIYNPKTGQVRGINALGVAPTGATPEFFRRKGMRYPPGEGPLAALTPGTPGGLMTMLAEFGTMSLRQVLQPATEMAEGYPMDEETSEKMERTKGLIKMWPSSRRVFLPHLGDEYEAPRPGEVFAQPDLRRTFGKLVEAEAEALKAGKDRKAAIRAAYDRFYTGDIAEEFVRGSQELGGLHTMEDLAKWQVYVEDPVMTTYKGIEVYKLNCWVQGPAMLQILNMLEPLNIEEMGLNSSRYIHALCQVMNLAFADRDFYYGDPYFPPEEPMKGLLSKDYARERVREIDWTRNNPDARPGDPYPFEGRANPFLHLLQDWTNRGRRGDGVGGRRRAEARPERPDDFHAGTTSIQAADKEGWVVSITPSGGWIPACIAGETGVGMSQRMQSFVLEEADNPFNVVAPGKRPRATLSPTMALKNGKPVLSFSLQGGDSQEQSQVQFLLNVLEFGMTVQEACEGPNFESFQLRASFGQHRAEPGKLVLNELVPSWVRQDLWRLGYRLSFERKTSGPLTAIYFDRRNGTLWGGASNHGEDYGIAW